MSASQLCVGSCSCCVACAGGPEQALGDLGQGSPPPPLTLFLCHPCRRCCWQGSTCCHGALRTSVCAHITAGQAAGGGRCCTCAQQCRLYCHRRIAAISWSRLRWMLGSWVHMHAMMEAVSGSTCRSCASVSTNACHKKQCGCGITTSCSSAYGSMDGCPQVPLAPVVTPFSDTVLHHLRMV